MTGPVCPECGKDMRCLGGCSAHASNWYCTDDTYCGYQAWSPVMRASSEVVRKARDKGPSDDARLTLEKEIVRLRAFVQRGCDLLHPLAGNEEIDAYRRRVAKVLR